VCPSGQVCVDGKCVSSLGVNFCSMYQDSHKNEVISSFSGKWVGYSPCSSCKDGYDTGCESCVIDDPVFSPDSVVPVGGVVRCTGCRFGSKCSEGPVDVEIDISQGPFFMSSGSGTLVNTPYTRGNVACISKGDCKVSKVDQGQDPDYACTYCPDLQGSYCNISC
jgi:hypothetical protein